MKAKKRFNLESPTQIREPCDLSNLKVWFEAEMAIEAEPSIRKVVLDVAENLDSFVRWPGQAVLLWRSCTRETKYHKYPDVIKNLAVVLELKGLDGRVNGPSILAFRCAGGQRPKRLGSNNSWSVHHLYSGKFPYVERQSTVHAAKDGLHCTQSAGLVAIHPIADQMCDEFPAFSWLLRAKAYLKFGYDPDHIFASPGLWDEFGFSERKCIVIPIPEQAQGSEPKGDPDCLEMQPP